MADKDTMPKIKKELGKNIYGPAPRSAEGAKRVRPGDADSTSAKRVGAAETLSQMWTREWMERLAARGEENESFISGAREELLKRGWMNSTEAQTMTKRKLSGRT